MSLCDVNCDLTRSLDKNVQDLVNNNHQLTNGNFKARLMSATTSENSLFDSALLAKHININELKFSYDKFELKYDESSNEYWFDLGDHLVLRPLQRDDYERGYLTLLEQLTVVGALSKEHFESRFDAMKASKGTYYTLVVANTNTNQIAASTTLVYEQKFIRMASSRGRIEDVVVDSTCRGKKLSKILLDVACQLSKKLGNYKLSLECKDQLRPLYEQFEFVKEENQNYLCRRF